MYIWEYWFRDNFKVLIIRLWWFWSLLSKASPKSISKVFQCGSLKISKIWTIFIFGHCFTKGSTFGFQKLWLHILAVSWTKSRLFNARLRDHLHHLIYICLPESKMTKMKVSIKFVLNVPLPSRFLNQTKEQPPWLYVFKMVHIISKGQQMRSHLRR